jgi:NAD(P)-dependent dehydrogenase (short-subunit alcohol dehydrogenase family)
VSGFGDRRALVTGGASGIGHATASLLSELGAKVVLLDLDADAARRAAEGLSAHAVTADVRHPDEVEAAVAGATRSLAGQPDLLVNAAGIYRFCPALEIDVAEWDDVLDTNLRGSWLVARAVARRLVDAERPGTIVNISSTAGLVADRDEPAVHYNASKAGVIALTKQLAVELAPHAIRVNAVCPGLIDTPMLRIMDEPAVGRRYLDERVPLRRLGRPEEVASLIAFLSSDEARYVTGVAVPIDGGLTAI